MDGQEISDEAAELVHDEGAAGGVVEVNWDKLLVSAPQRVVFDVDVTFTWSCGK